MIIIKYDKSNGVNQRSAVFSKMRHPVFLALG